MADRPKVLVLIDWYLPAYKAGGPVRSVAAMIERLGAQVEFRVFTSAHDHGTDKPHEGIVTDTWTTAPDGTPVFYCSSPSSIRENFRRCLEEFKPGCVYLNSLFSADFTLYPLRQLQGNSGIRIVLAPRGMLGAGALAIKPLRKKIFLRYARWKGIYQGVTWHASTLQEKKEIEDVFGKEENCIVALNFSAPQFAALPKQKKAGAVRLVFVSRISRKKNLGFLIALLGELKFSGEISLEIAGPAEEQEYLNDCLRKAGQLPAGINVSYLGSLPPAEVAAVLAGSHFFVLPTLHENFGHVISEAAAAGCGLIISDQTPWRSLEMSHAGWDIPLEEKEKWKAALLAAVAMGQEEFNTVALAAQQTVRAMLGSEELVRTHLTLFSGNNEI